MKRILLPLLLLFSLVGFSQLTPVSCDLGFANARVEDLNGNLIDANTIIKDQVLKVKVNVFNFSDETAPAGHFRVRIGLGAALVLNNTASLSTAPLSTEFNWSYDLTGAQPQIVGNSIAPLPAYYVGTAEFVVKAVNVTTSPIASTLSFNFLISNPPNTTTPLSDPEPSNNVASNLYTVAAALTFTQTKQNVSCFGLTNGSVVLTASGGVPNPNYSYILVNTGTSTTYGPNTTGIFNGLPPGAYNISVSDGSGNMATGSTTVTEPTEVTVSAVSTNVTCNGAANGTIAVSNVSSGAAYTIKLNNTGADLSGQSVFGPGTYYVTATASGGNAGQTCSKTVTVTITQPAAIAINTITQSPVACNGGTATVIITAQGGTPPYNYTFNSVVNQNGVFNTVSAGTYSYSITDANNCPGASGNFTVIQPPVITVSNVAQGVISCKGGTTTVTITAAGGTGSLAYTFNGSTQSNNVFLNVPAGTYLYSVTDANHCTAAMGNFSVTEPNAITVSNVQQTAVNCFGGKATVTLTAQGGTGALSYTFNGMTHPENAFANVSAGTYSYSVTDANSCPAATGTFTVMQPPVLAVGTITQSTIACDGGKATVTIPASGGTGSLSYTFNGIMQTSNSFANISAGNYSYSVTDANTCGPVTGSFTVVQPDAITASAAVTTAVACNGGTATVTITASGGTGALLYTFNGVTQSNAVFSGVPAGTNLPYSVTDANGCTAATGTVTVSQPTVLTIGLTSQTNNACNGGSTGSVTVSGGGGTPGYTYSISGPPNTSGQSSGVFTGLAAGSYTVTVADANSCTKSTTATVTQPTGIKPDVTLSVADYTDNFFPSNGSEVTLIYQISEVGGNPALNDTLNITKQSSYTYTFLSAPVTIGGTTYNFDYPRWTVDNTGLAQYRLLINNGQQLGCGQSVYLGVKITRNTPNKSVFTLTSNARSTYQSEASLTNNATTVVLVAQ